MSQERMCLMYIGLSLGVYVRLFWHLVQ